MLGTALAHKHGGHKDLHEEKQMLPFCCCCCCCCFLEINYYRIISLCPFWLLMLKKGKCCFYMVHLKNTLI